MKRSVIFNPSLRPCYFVCVVNALSFKGDEGLTLELRANARRKANARNVRISLLPYGGINYFINSFDYPNLLCFRGNMATTILNKSIMFYFLPHLKTCFLYPN